MFELLPEKLGQADSLPSTSKEDKKERDKRVVNILQCFHTYMGVQVQTQLARTQDLLAYASLVVHATRKFKGNGWAT